jgi:hypothetical protein
LDAFNVFRGIDFAEVLYRGSEGEKSPFVRKTLYFVVADDTYVSEAELSLRILYDGCKMQQLQKISDSASVNQTSLISGQNQ